MKRALLLSLCIHGLFILAGNLLAKVSPVKMENQAIEIEVLPLAKQRKVEASIVRHAEPPPDLLKEIHNPEARFLSMTTQRVQTETQASLRGLTENHKNSASQKSKITPPEKLSDFQPDSISPRNELAAMNKKLSTVGESLPSDVKIGSFTALNTNRFQYYSFYARIEELIRFRWESKVQQMINEFDQSYVLNVIGKKQWSTQVEFWLLPNGDFHSAHIYKESGQKKFDDAAIFAFSNARHFPNPPPEMVEKDGYIHLLYNFNVEFKSSPMAQR